MLVMWTLCMAVIRESFHVVLYPKITFNHSFTIGALDSSDVAMSWHVQFGSEVSDVWVQARSIEFNHLFCKKPFCGGMRASSPGLQGRLHFGMPMDASSFVIGSQIEYWFTYRRKDNDAVEITPVMVGRWPRNPISNWPRPRCELVDIECIMEEPQLSTRVDELSLIFMRVTTVPPGWSVRNVTFNARFGSRTIPVLDHILSFGTLLGRYSHALRLSEPHDGVFV